MEPRPPSARESLRVGLEERRLRKDDSAWRRVGYIPAPLEVYTLTDCSADDGDDDDDESSTIA